MKHREIILDTETTGLTPLKGHKIIEIGAIELINKKTTGEKFHYYIDPERSIPIESYRIHGISIEMLRDKPKFHEIADKFIKFIKGATLIIHNAVFDLRFLNYELQRLNKPQIDISNVVDTLKIARTKFPGQKATLDALCKKYKISLSNRTFHGALKDAELLKEVYLNLSEIKQQTTLNLESPIIQSNNKYIINKSYSDYNLKIIKPNSKELLQHEKSMAAIINKD